MPNKNVANFDLKAVPGEQRSQAYGLIRVSAREEIEVVNICAFFETGLQAETDQRQLYISPDLFYFGRERELGKNRRGNLPSNLEPLRFAASSSATYVSTTVERLQLSPQHKELLGRVMSRAKMDLAEKIVALGRFARAERFNDHSQGRLAGVPPELRRVAVEKGLYYSAVWNVRLWAGTDYGESTITADCPLDILPEWTKRYTTR
ncbi:MAG: hypothetical protein AB1668_07240 [Nanoarchaeota archaeon]